ncbi:uncharacterized protein MELLADRAFT_113719 [Melampsora larici-populina 98AG31]|uniref:Uncharacterized protein n=1 Tax=Melampsora larici-populina (strain 98AG31 / pathotype 3-4-7) TaxID=747676 RepID=F4SAV2_MELLP|nr:uncharacterized protein MELLADRAFT_113719 [Melampsora larici-populina 98AG31]EGF98241.1 hypothetical protein MELLADRAFT_113719 [Melampsora larici-populina 98AG31]
MPKATKNSSVRGGKTPTLSRSAQSPYASHRRASAPNLIAIGSQAESEQMPTGDSVMEQLGVDPDSTNLMDLSNDSASKKAALVYEYFEVSPTCVKPVYYNKCISYNYFHCNCRSQYKASSMMNILKARFQ